MQSTPLRLQQTIWNAFRASKPNNTFRTYSQFIAGSRVVAKPPFPVWPTRFSSARLYSDDKKLEADRQVRDAQRGIESDVRTHTDAAKPESAILNQDATIVSTKPRPSSMVNDEQNLGKVASKGSSIRSTSSTKQLPSEASSRHSDLRHRFSHFMDTFQSQVFVASQRLNDLTGYSGIEALKKDIEAQEAQVRNARNQVKETRSDYTAAVENRSTTQREVNDLLQRKHAWSPADLERFTNLYRSDHANEQAEQKAHEKLGRAESEYEEASTKLAKSILARYHEEQIWSDKIRQMSTWGTWGLMGLNILLFIVVQIMLEPWRRRRLVRGFEDKVQEALRERQGESTLEPKSKEADQIVEDALGIVAVAGDKAAEAVADAITGATDSQVKAQKTPSQPVIEQAAEQAAVSEILQEDANEATVAAISETVEEAGAPDSIFSPKDQSSQMRWESLPATMFGKISNGFAHYEDRFSELFNEKALVLVSRRDLTTAALEGAFAGAALMATLLWTVRNSR